MRAVVVEEVPRSVDGVVLPCNSELDRADGPAYGTSQL